MTTPQPRYKELLRRARKMRSDPTDAEARLWTRLRRKQLDGHKFRRQYILKPYIVDFYCLARKVVVEVDGRQHEQPSHREWDARRDTYLREEYGVEILRFSAADVFARTEVVLEEIRSVLGVS